jgi:hypothetical protein
VNRKPFAPWLVAAVIFGPFAAAMLVFYASPNLDWLPRLPGARELVEPPAATAPGWLQTEPADGAEPRWSLLYARMAACDDQCGRDLERLRQVHVALARDFDKLQLVFVHGGELDPASAPARDPGLATRSLDDDEAEPVRRVVGPERLERGLVVVADPAGLLVVTYPVDVEQKELLRDLKRLLAVGSH